MSEGPNQISTDILSRALCRHPAIQDSHVSLRKDGDNLLFDRDPWWKRYLAEMDAIPLKLLPHVLEKADNWKCDTSHSHLDVLYYLVKEKHTVLLQNVHRRRIRKRKRYGLDA